MCACVLRARVSVWLCVCLCVCVCVRVCVCACLCECVYVHACVCMCVRAHVCVCVFVRAYACVCVCERVSVCEMWNYWLLCGGMQARCRQVRMGAPRLQTRIDGVKCLWLSNNSRIDLLALFLSCSAPASYPVNLCTTYSYAQVKFEKNEWCHKKNH
jgi:hypothetical protein